MSLKLLLGIRGGCPAKALPKLCSLALLLTALLAGALALCAQSAAPVELQYRLRLQRPTTHLVEVEITVDRVATPALDFMSKFAEGPAADDPSTAVGTPPPQQPAPVATTSSSPSSGGHRQS